MRFGAFAQRGPRDAVGGRTSVQVGHRRNGTDHLFSAALASPQLAITPSAPAQHNGLDGGCPGRRHRANWQVLPHLSDSG
jgi:hypothetical protein